MNEPLRNLLDAARKKPQSPSELEIQRRSFAYGNTHFENELITREMVERVADELAKSGHAASTTKSK
ncbi:hypothetical protein [Sinorhizobium fredii]|uniref:hypothetical protein n=1 Tax=Rhizobium fredii TaxID=380 RepID=UPI0035150757